MSPGQILTWTKVCPDKCLPGQISIHTNSPGQTSTQTNVTKINFNLDKSLPRQMSTRANVYPDNCLSIQISPWHISTRTNVYLDRCLLYLPKLISPDKCHPDKRHADMCRCTKNHTCAFFCWSLNYRLHCTWRYCFKDTGQGQLACVLKHKAPWQTHLDEACPMPFTCSLKF